MFLFHEPLLSPDAAASAEPGVYEGVSQVLEVVEKMPSLSYYLTQMALAESKSSSFQNQTSSDNDEEDGDSEIEIGKSEALPDASNLEDVETEEDEDDSQLKPLLSVPFENWMNCIVKNVSKGPLKGAEGKVVRISSGWVTVKVSEGSSFSKRAADLKVIEQSTVVSGELYQSEEKHSVNNGAIKEAKKPSLVRSGPIKKRKRNKEIVHPSLLPTSSRRNASKPVRYQVSALSLNTG